MGRPEEREHSRSLREGRKIQVRQRHKRSTVGRTKSFDAVPISIGTVFFMSFRQYSRV